MFHQLQPKKYGKAEPFNIQSPNDLPREGLAVKKRYYASPSFSLIKRRRVEVDFKGGEITSDGGVLLLREVDRRLRLSEAVSKAIPDHCNTFFCVHSWAAVDRQRLFGLALGYEDLHEHIQLRLDGAVQTVVGDLCTLASPATLYRPEKRASKQAALDLH